KLDVDQSALTGVSKEKARDLAWNAFDQKYRPEMQRVERGLVLDYLDRGWKSHLYDMDHLRQGIGLVGYAQIDPKTEYKRLGMKQFDEMGENVAGKVTDVVFRLESDDIFQESVWSISSAVHEQMTSALPPGDVQAIPNQTSEKKKEPIRNRQEKIGR